MCRADWVIPQIGEFNMTRIYLSAAAAIALSTPASAGSSTIADHCIAQVSKGAITEFRDVDVLASGRDRIAYFRCVRTGGRDEFGVAAFALTFPRIEGISGGFFGT